MPAASHSARGDGACRWTVRRESGASEEGGRAGTREGGSQSGETNKQTNKPTRIANPMHVLCMSDCPCLSLSRSARPRRPDHPARGRLVTDGSTDRVAAAWPVRAGPGQVRAGRVTSARSGREAAALGDSWPQHGLGTRGARGLTASTSNAHATRRAVVGSSVGTAFHAVLHCTGRVQQARRRL